MFASPLKKGKRMKKPTLNIAVTGLNAIDSPGPGIAVIRGLRESTLMLG